MSFEPAAFRAPPRPLRHLVLVLGDQLDPASSAFDGFDPTQDAVWMAEVREESTHVWSSQPRTALFLAAMFATAVSSVHPAVLPSTLDPAHALTVAGTAAPEYGLRVGLAWWIPGMLLVAGYFTWTYRKWAGRVGGEGEGY